MTPTQLEAFPAEDYRVVPEPAPERTSGQKRRDRQALRIALGLHPLSIEGMRIPLHPDAPRDAAKDDERPYPRCGTCVMRELVGGHSRSYPKCRAAAPTVYQSPRYSHGADTDVRAWWPACGSYEARPEVT
jgi:hypothetical protein